MIKLSYLDTKTILSNGNVIEANIYLNSNYPLNGHPRRTEVNESIRRGVVEGVAKITREEIDGVLARLKPLGNRDARFTIADGLIQYGWDRRERKDSWRALRIKALPTYFLLNCEVTLKNPSEVKRINNAISVYCNLLK